MSAVEQLAQAILDGRVTLWVAASPAADWRIDIAVNPEPEINAPSPSQAQS